MHAALVQTLRSCQALLPASFRDEHQRLFLDEHLDKLARRLIAFHQDGVPAEQPPPHLSVECTPPLAEAFAPFVRFFAQWQQEEPPVAVLAESLVQATTKNLLVMLGQRLTPASLTDARALPPARADLLAASAAIHAGKLSVGARALTKHLQRNDDAFWGELAGPDDEKSAAAHQLIGRILDTATWWNVFGHYKHDIVFEARTPEGYGARWGNDGQNFIGFLEPFTSDFPTVRD